MPGDSHALLPGTARFAGRLVDQSLTLEKFLEGTGSYGRFSTHVSGRPAIAHVYPYQSGQVAVWKKVQALNHPSLLEILATGASSWSDLEFSYMVTEAPSEVVADVLKDRPLHPSEARELLISVLQGLDALHKNGLVHCAVNPENIVATEDAVKLTVQSIRSPEGDCTSAFDVRAVGTTVFQTLTQRLPLEQHSFDVSALPAPFSTILLRCLEKDPKQRWGAADLLVLLGENVPNPLMEVKELAPPKVKPAPHASEPVGRDIPPKPVYVAPQPSSPSISADPAIRVAKFVVPAVAVFLVAMTIFLLYRGRLSRPAARSEAVQTAAATSSTAIPAAPSNNPTTAPRSSASAVPPGQATNAGSSSSDNWRVIAFTYNSEQAAKHKADFINGHESGMDAQVFSPQPGRYLVSLGSWMSRDDAMRLRQKALKRGMPGDTYAQNFRR